MCRCGGYPANGGGDGGYDDGHDACTEQRIGVEGVGCEGFCLTHGDQQDCRDQQYEGGLTLDHFQLQGLGSDSEVRRRSVVLWHAPHCPTTPL